MITRQKRAADAGSVFVGSVFVAKSTTMFTTGSSVNAVTSAVINIKDCSVEVTHNNHLEMICVKYSNVITPHLDIKLFTMPGNGRCVCGVCMCLPAYRGRACECPLSLESCLSQDKQICAGRGDCHCGTCICHDRFQGPTCELCPSCPSVCTLHR